VTSAKTVLPRIMAMAATFPEVDSTSHSTEGQF